MFFNIGLGAKNHLVNGRQMKTLETMLKDNGHTEAVLLVFIHRIHSRAPEAVWQVWRPTYQSKIWYGDAIPIKSKAAKLFIICNKSRIKTSAFLYVSEP